MRTMWSGLNGWFRLEAERSEEVRTVDTALTVVFALFVAATYALLHR